MKIAITAKGTDLNAEVDPRFGRAAYILIVDVDTLDCEVVNNQENVNRLKGAGIQAATLISDKKAEVLLTGFCGPNAVQTLNAAKIKVATEVNGIVKDAVEAFKQGKYSYTDQPNTEGHWV
ncbi:NifB/NifX family molybdenum-iron cluster-binding protein [bacterium]|nr:NifB/NifX family molybdenum-iron cluster-binding protein [bacterium]